MQYHFDDFFSRDLPAGVPALFSRFVLFARLLTAFSLQCLEFRNGITSEWKGPLYISRSTFMSRVTSSGIAKRN